MKPVLACLAVLTLASGAYAAPGLQIKPDEIIVDPGDIAQFEVRLTDATQFAGFYIELGITPQPGATGSVEFLGATGDSNSEYCFYGFSDLSQDVVIGGLTLAAGDQADPPSIEVTTMADVNDLLAVVEIDTSLDA
ncbi:MAG: hypothetical protein JXA69_08235 [Phycisphaerae bacterium]|nr:hypothetical protein [Phycisphaerae bacterium]